MAKLRVPRRGFAPRLFPVGGAREKPWLLRKGVRGSEVFIADRERYTLLAVRSVFDVLSPTPFFEDVASICEKLSDSVSPAERGMLGASRRFRREPSVVCRRRDK
jgi:hypothetical protein